MPLPDTEPQNLKYMNYIALTNQLLIIHDILHDFSPSSNKARLSKSTNLIKQTIAHVTTIPLDMMGGMKRVSRDPDVRAIRARPNRPITREEIRQIIEFFISNLLPPSLIDSLRELKEGRFPAIQFFQRCFVYKPYITKPAPHDSIMSRRTTRYVRLYRCTISTETYYDMREVITKAYTNNFMEIFNTYINTNLSIYIIYIYYIQTDCILHQNYNDDTALNIDVLR